MQREEEIWLSNISISVCVWPESRCHESNLVLLLCYSFAQGLSMYVSWVGVEKEGVSLPVRDAKI